MKFLLSLFLFACSLGLFAQTTSLSSNSVSPLATYSNAWNDTKYSKCNTAANAPYMSSDEKEVIYILNLIRTDPALFSKTVLKKYPSVSGKGHLVNDEYYYQSLVKKLNSMQPLNLLEPDRSCFESAQCHASTSGRSGYAGHKRTNANCSTKKNYNGECCDYGQTDPLDIVLSLLIDEGVPSLGHRNIMLSSYNKVGVSIQPHKIYRTNTVIDFLY